VVSDGGNMTLEREGHSWKAHASIVLSEGGKVIEVREVRLETAPLMVFNCGCCLLL